MALLEADLIAAQMGRAPRDPWAVAVRCEWGYPSVIESPAILDDGSPFPTREWLTCPWLCAVVSAEESAGAAARWASRATSDPLLAEELRRTDAALRHARAAEYGGLDLCAVVGIAGQRDPLGVKCLHAHVALALAGFKDPIGTELLSRVGAACSDERCSSLRGLDSQVGS